jgi:hypothetical protein
MSTYDRRIVGDITNIFDVLLPSRVVLPRRRNLIHGLTRIVAWKSASSGSWNEQPVVLALLSLQPLLQLLGWPGVVRTLNYYCRSENRSGNLRLKSSIHHPDNFGVPLFHRRIDGSRAGTNVCCLISRWPRALFHMPSKRHT